MTLAGLRIARVGAGEAAPSGVDLSWHVRRVADIADCPRDGTLITHGADAVGGALTHFHFGHRGRVHCRFTLDAKATSVACVARREVSERDLVNLLGEYILRTVLVRHGLLSFHAAAVAKEGRALLLMGHKGAGKSTLSTGMRQSGWTLLADDLARVSEDPVDDDGDPIGAWRAHAGLRETKLLVPAARALGFDPDAMPRRWDDAGVDGATSEADKVLARAEPLPAGQSTARVAALIVLDPRGGGGNGLAAERLGAGAAVRAALDHLTRDAAVPTALPAAIQRAFGRLVQTVPVLRLSLPDDIAALAASIGAIEAMVAALPARETLGAP